MEQIITSALLLHPSEPEKSIISNGNPNKPLPSFCSSMKLPLGFVLLIIIFVLFVIIPFE